MLTGDFDGVVFCYANYDDAVDVDDAFDCWAFLAVVQEAFEYLNEVAYRVVVQVAFLVGLGEVLCALEQIICQYIFVFHFRQYRKLHIIRVSYLGASEFPFPSVALVAVGTSWMAEDRLAAVEVRLVV